MHERNDFHYYVLLNSISIISGQWEDDNVIKSYVQSDPIDGCASAGMELGMARLAGQRFTYSYRGS